MELPSPLVIAAKSAYSILHAARTLPHASNPCRESPQSASALTRSSEAGTGPQSPTPIPCSHPMQPPHAATPCCHPMQHLCGGIDRFAAQKILQLNALAVAQVRERRESMNAESLSGSRYLHGGICQQAVDQQRETLCERGRQSRRHTILEGWP